MKYNLFVPSNEAAKENQKNLLLNRNLKPKQNLFLLGRQQI